MQRRITTFALPLLLVLGATACADQIDTHEAWELNELDSEPAPEPEPGPEPGPAPEPDPEPAPEPTPDPEPEPEPDINARFIGTWTVHDNVPRGGITADIYVFHEDGRLELLDRFDPAGVVLQCDRDEGDDACSMWDDTRLRCDFGERWESSGPQSLKIEGTCSDGEDRMIELAFPESVEGNAAGPGVEAKLVSVGGESDGWFASTFMGPGGSFFFVRCEESGQGACWFP